MSVSKISVRFEAMYVVDDSSCWGPGQWSLIATVDGAAVGDATQIFEARQRQLIALDAGSWSTEVDVDGKGEGSSVDVQFEVQQKGKSLGKTSASLKFPYKQELALDLPGSATGGGLFSSAHSRYTLHLAVKIVQEKVTSSLPGQSDLFTNRQATGTDTFTTLSGAKLAPRVEICPVVPVPGARSLPPRPKFPAGFAAGKLTPQAERVELSSGSSLNALPNPALIPFLDQKDPDIQSKAARVAVTYMEPGNLETGNFAWSVKSGPVAFQGETDGKTEVLVYGADGGADQEAVIELRWKPGGPLLSTFRALAGSIKEIPFRALVLNPSDAAQQIRTSPGDVAGQIAIANVLLWQAGLKLVPDPEKGVQPPKQFAGFDGVTKEGDDGSGVFSLTLPPTLDKWSMAVDTDKLPEAARINFRPGVLNIVYIKSTIDDVAITIDRSQLKGGNATDNGSPSTSWVQPSGVPPDGDAGSVSMQTSQNTGRQPKQDFPAGSSVAALQLPDNFDVERKYLKKRLLPDEAMNWLYSLLIPDLYASGDPSYGVLLAHLACQAMGLKSRGFFNGDQVGSEDGINHPNGFGYPFWENLMAPGAILPWSQDLDLIQTKFLRNHALANGKFPALAPLTVAAGFDQSRYPGDDEMKAWSLASPYAFVCYYLKSPNHKSASWMGKKDTLVKQGWGFLPAYFGQQPDGTPNTSHHELTEDQGETDGQDAVQKMSDEGFPENTYVYLDVEYQDVLSDEFKDYISAWVVAVATNQSNDHKSYQAGIYMARHNADDVKKAVDDGLADHDGVSVRYWIVGGNQFSLDSDPTNSGKDYADAWQSPYFEIKEKHGVKLTIDQDVSSRQDPSAPDPAAPAAPAAPAN